MRAHYLIIFAIATTLAFVEAQDISILLMDQRFVEQELKCIMETGPCGPIGTQIKRLLPEALNNRCRRCTLQQAKNARKLVEFMRSHYSKQWKIIAERYTEKKIGSSTSSIIPLAN